MDYIDHYLNSDYINCSTLFKISGSLAQKCIASLYARNWMLINGLRLASDHIRSYSSCIPVLVSHVGGLPINYITGS